MACAKHAGAGQISRSLLYYLSFRAKEALCIFLLLPIAFGPFFYELLIIFGVLLSRGDF